MCHAHVSHKYLYHLDVCAGRSILTPHDCITNVQKRLGNGVWRGFGQCRLCGSFLDPQLEHGEACSTAEATRGHYACVHAVVCGIQLADPGITTEPRGPTKAQSRSADIFTTAAVPGRSAALDVCVASSSAAAARGDAVQASFDRKLSNDRNEIPDLRNQGIHCRPLVSTAAGPPHPAVTRTLQYAADIASSRNDQQMSAKLLQRRWKHELQIALLRRRAAMTQAVLPNPSARAEWLLAGTMMEPFIIGATSSFLTVDLETTTTQTPRLTQPYRMVTTTLLFSPVNRQHLCSRQASNCPPLPSRGSLLPLFRRFRVT